MYSNHTLSSALADSNLADADAAVETNEPSENAHNAPPTNGHFAAISTENNGVKLTEHVVIGANVCESTSSRSATPVSPPKIFAPTKSVEVARPASKSNVWPENKVMQNSYSNANRMALKISSVASGEGVALMTNGLPITADDLTDELDDEMSNEEKDLQPKICAVKSLATAQSNDELPKFDEPNDNACSNDDPMTCVPNKYGDLLISTKTEPIDISDDDHEQIDYPNESEVDVLVPTHTAPPDIRFSGYIYCTTNVQLGKVNVECLSGTTIKLYLKEPVDIVYEGWQSQKRQPSLVNVTKYMQTYIRENFYGIYPAHLKFDWIFISAEQIDQDAITLCDFNTIDPLSVRRKSNLGDFFLICGNHLPMLIEIDCFLSR